MNRNRTSLTTKILCGIILFACGCKSIPFQPSTHKDDFLTIGSGGGFAGVETKYHLLTNGDLYLQYGLDTTITEQKSIDRKVAKQAFDNCETFKLHSYDYQQPDNTYKFLEVNMNGKTNRIVWSGDDEKISPVCKQIYQSINTIINAK